MSTSTTTASAPGSSAVAPTSDATAHRVQPTGRGTLTVPASVVAKIAAQAAAELPTVGAASGGVLGLGARRDFTDRPQAEAELYGNTAVISVDLGITYPTPLRTGAEAIRNHIARRVGELTGFDVGRIDLQISWLHPAPSTTTRGALL
ncbi:Asp23/Gls24 family envelope stress response protein [Kocuria rhizophila]|nr:Asp23/Gls24 family envelope stress response protein [Kocuria rhizophila]